MLVHAWSNGSPRPTGAGYGVRIALDDRDRHFDMAWVDIEVALDGLVSVTVPLSASFWRTCTELRSACIGRWLLSHNLAPWPRGNPPTVVLSPTHHNHFQLSLLPPGEARTHSRSRSRR